MTMRLSLVIEGDGSGAKRALQETATAVEELGRKSDDAAKRIEGVSKGIQWNDAEFDRARNGLKSTADEGERAAESVAAVADAGAKAAPEIIKIGDAAETAGGKFSNLGGVILGAVGGFAAGVAITAVGEGFKIAAGYAGDMFREITSNQPEIERALENHATLVGRIKGAYSEASGAASSYGLNSMSVMRFDAQQNVARTEGAFASVQSDLSESGFFTPIMQDMAGGRDRLGPYREAINELRRELRDGSADVIAFRQEVSAIGAALPDDSEWRAVGERIRVQIEDAAKVQVELERSRDLLKAVEGNADAAAKPLGRRSTAFTMETLLS